MFKKQAPIKTESQKKLEIAIDEIMDHIITETPGTPEHDLYVKQYVALTNLLPAKPEKKQIDPNALIAAGASLGGILVIVTYEHAHVVASKALGFVLKTKL